MRALVPLTLMVAAFLLEAPLVAADTGCSAITMAHAGCDNGESSDPAADSGPKRASCKSKASMGDAFGKSRARAALKVRQQKPWATLKAKAKAEGEECSACASALATANGDFAIADASAPDEVELLPLTVRTIVPALFLYTVTDDDEETVAEQSYECSVLLDGESVIQFGIALADSEITLSGDIVMDDLSILAVGTETAVRLDDFEIERILEVGSDESVHSFGGSCSDSACGGGGAAYACGRARACT